MAGQLSPGDRNKKHIEINLGLKCNNACRFCVSDGPAAFVSIEEVRREIEDYANRGCNSLGFIGGEPTIFPGIADLCRHAVRSGFRHIHLISNGRRYSDAAFLDSLIASGVTRFSVSVHSHIEEVENYLCGGRERAYAEKILGLRNLVQRHRERRFPDLIAINIVMNKLNLPELEHTIGFFADMGLSEFRLLIIRPENRALRNFEELVPPMTQVRAKIPDILKLVQQRGVRVILDSPPYCVFYDIPQIAKLLSRDYIDEVVLSGRNLDRKRFSWADRRANEEKVKQEHCASCCFDAVCEGVWRGYVQARGFGEFHAVPDGKLCGR